MPLKKETKCFYLLHYRFSGLLAGVSGIRAGWPVDQ